MWQKVLIFVAFNVILMYKHNYLLPKLEKYASSG